MLSLMIIIAKYIHKTLPYLIRTPRSSYHSLFINILQRVVREERLRKLFWLCLLLALIYRLFISWNTFAYVDNIFVIDDSYYCFNIARNIALGKGATCDGIHQTNGFQLLYVLLLVPLYLLFPDNKIMPIHIALTFLSLCNLVTGLIIFKMVRRFADYKAALFSFFLWSFSPYCLVNGVNGMETPLAGLLFLLAVYFYVMRIKYAETYSRKRFIYLGCITGLAVLSRIDQGLLLFTICCDRLWFYWKQGRVGNLKNLFVELFLILFFSSLLFSPWMFWSYRNFGSFIPQSGEIVNHISWALFSNISFKFFLFPLLGVIATIGTIADMLFPLLHTLLRYLSPHLYLAILLTLILSLVFFISLYLSIRPFFFANSHFVRQLYSRIRPLSFLILFVLSFSLAYIFGVGGWYYYQRYYFPIFVVLILFLGLTFPLFSQQEVFKRAALKYYIAKLTCMGMYLATVLLLVILTLFYRPAKLTMGYYKIGEWINQHLDEKAVIGGFQSGAMSYLADDRTIINLDGVVNYQAHAALCSSNFLAYIRSQKIQYIIDWGTTFYFIERTYPDTIVVGRDIKLKKVISSFYTLTRQWKLYEVVYPKD